MKRLILSPNSFLIVSGTGLQAVRLTLHEWLFTGYNIVSELIRPNADHGVIAWVEAQVPEDLFLASMTIGELPRGASNLGDTRRGAKHRQ